MASDLLAALGMRIETCRGPSRFLLELEAKQDEDDEAMLEGDGTYDEHEQDDNNIKEDVNTESSAIANGISHLEKKRCQDDTQFASFLGGFVTNLDPEYNTALEEMLEHAKNVNTSLRMQEIVEEVALAVATLDVETDAIM